MQSVSRGSQHWLKSLQHIHIFICQQHLFQNGESRTITTLRNRCHQRQHLQVTDADKQYDIDFIPPSLSRGLAKNKELGSRDAHYTSILLNLFKVLRAKARIVPRLEQLCVS